MERIPNLLVLALVGLALAAVASWYLRLPFPVALVMILAGVMARGFVVAAATEPEPAPASGLAARTRSGIALALRLLIGTGVLALMLLSALWMLAPAG
ncbi:hypothetical protein [Pseudoxanthomonas sp. 10H]|uniref:hypothetical protein n=1 Tax=Pseudoxanthomonas sp. 10H TaxID=3242729 RepID=UPI003557E4F0